MDTDFAFNKNSATLWSEAIHLLLLRPTPLARQGAQVSLGSWGAQWDSQGPKGSSSLPGSRTVCSEGSGQLLEEMVPTAGTARGSVTTVAVSKHGQVM